MPQHWVDVQREQFKRLGISGDWDNPYLTMDFEAEATIVAELLKFAESGQLYRGAKPVMWSPVEKTALAEAEIEYEDIVSTQIDVAFEIVESPIPELVGAYAVVWTTTPWTIPVNQGDRLRAGRRISSADSVDASLMADDASVADRAAGRLLVDGLVRLACRRADRAVELKEHALGTVKGSDLAGTIARHPMHQLGGFFAKPRPFLPGDFVTTDQGTGLVHMAPDHGEDDFELCKAQRHRPGVRGRGRRQISRATGCGSAARAASSTPSSTRPTGRSAPTCARPAALLAASADFQHSYPHSVAVEGQGHLPLHPAMVRARWTGRCRDSSPRRCAEQRWENEGGAIDDVCDDRNACASWR